MELQLVHIDEGGARAGSSHSAQDVWKLNKWQRRIDCKVVES